MLQDYGIDGFEQTENYLIANGNDTTIDQTGIENYCSLNQISYKKSRLKEENWNKIWESEFNPVIVDTFCAIRAEFHSPIKSVPYEIVITPKMSFGTGHHATTWMMIKAMESYKFSDKVVIDFGTGTGILAILAEKLGAKKITAVDYDECSIENAHENIYNNQCLHVSLLKAENLGGIEPADLILANINKNVILGNFPDFKRLLIPGGILLVSGILREDEPDITYTAAANGLIKRLYSERNGWLCLSFENQEAASLQLHESFKLLAG